MPFRQYLDMELGMARKTGRAALVLNAGQRAKLEKLAGSRTAAWRKVERVKVLLAYAQDQGPTEIQRTVGVSRPTIYRCIDKALAGGVEMGLHDRYHRPRAPQASSVSVEESIAYI